jgi:CRISPR-associated protein Cas1
MATLDAWPTPDAAVQYNWITSSFEPPLPEQLMLALEGDTEILLPDDGTVTLLATESGSQLFVSGFGLGIGKKSERIVIRRKGEVCAQLPLIKLQELVIGSRGVSLSSDLIEELCQRGIRIAFLSGGGRPFALLTSPLLNATVETRRAQFAAREGAIGAGISRWIVAGKLRNQERLLRYFARTREGPVAAALLETAATLRRLRRSAESVEGETPDAVRPSLLGFEGVGGRLYWEQLSSLVPDAGFEGRVHRGPGDAVNAALNYGYGIVMAHVWGAALNAGLEPFAGFIHVDRSGKPSLVLDLVEEFRQPVVDRAIFGWLAKGGRLTLRAGMLDGPSKEEVAARVLGRLNARERHRGKEHEVRSIVQMQARLLASAVRGMRDYRPFSFTW